MSAEIICLAEVRALKTTNPATLPAALNADFSGGRAHQDRELVEESYQFWTGASGKRYVHTVYDLLTCPALPAANFMLVRKDASGVANVLSIGRVSNSASSLNLATIRRQGAKLGATEVHVHLLADDTATAQFIERDLQAGYLAQSWPEEKTAWAH